jgi:hypothetical protein
MDLNIHYSVQQCPSSLKQQLQMIGVLYYEALGLVLWPTIDEHAWCLTHRNCINCTTFVQVTSLFDFPPSLLPQVNHSFHIPIVSSLNSTPHGIDQHPAITYQEVLCPQDWCPTHTQYSLTQPQLPGSSIATASFDFYQFSCTYFYLNRMHQESWNPLTAILWPSLIFKFN